MISKFLNYAFLAALGLLLAFPDGGFWISCPENGGNGNSASQCSSRSTYAPSDAVSSDAQPFSKEKHPASSLLLTDSSRIGAEAPRSLHDEDSPFPTVCPLNVPVRNFQGMTYALADYFQNPQNLLPNREIFQNPLQCSQIQELQLQTRQNLQLLDEQRRRDDLFQRLNKRAEDFRLSASRLGFLPGEANRLLHDGWTTLTDDSHNFKSSIHFTENGSEIEFLLMALDALPDSDGVSRAKAFVQTGSDKNRSWPQYSALDQIRFAAIQLTEKLTEKITENSREIFSKNEEIAWSQVETDCRLLREWKSDSATLVLATVNAPSRPAPFPFAPENSPEIALFSSVSSVQNFRNLIAFSQLFLVPFEGLPAASENRFPKISFFKKFHALSAGRKPFLLI